jgi:hypothetical protein
MPSPTFPAGLALWALVSNFLKETSATFSQVARLRLIAPETSLPYLMLEFVVVRESDIETVIIFGFQRRFARGISEE